MNLKLGVTITIGLIGMLMSVLLLQGVVGGEWTVIGQSVAPVILVIALLGFLIAFIVGK